MKSAISIFISLVLLAIIYTKIDISRIWPVLRNCRWDWLAWSCALFVPVILLMAWRLDRFMPRAQKLGWAEACRMVLVAGVLNLFLPSRMGELSKAWFLKERGHLEGSVAFALVLFEKICDLLAIFFWCGLGLCFHPPGNRLSWVLAAVAGAGFLSGVAFLRSAQLAEIIFAIVFRLAPKRFQPRLEPFRLGWKEMQTFLWRDRARLAGIAAVSALITLLNLVQIWMLILALNAWVPLLASIGLSPLAVLAGLLPVTFAGVGTRDAALIFFYRAYLDAPTAGALGLLCTFRYFVLALGGLPFVGNFLTRYRPPDSGEKIFSQTATAGHNVSKVSPPAGPAGGTPAANDVSS